VGCVLKAADMLTKVFLRGI